MPFETECDQCQRSYKLKDELLGKKFKCRDCGAVVVAEAILPAISVKPKPVEEKRPVKRQRRSTTGSSTTPDRKPASEQTRRSASAKRSTTRSAKSAPPKRRRPQRSQKAGQYGSNDDQFDGYAEDYEEFEEANPFVESYGTSSAPKRSSKKKGKRQPASRRKKQGGINFGFNVNRLNLALAGIALALGLYAVSESRLAAKANSEPTTISMTELITNGQPDNIYVTVTGVAAAVDEYVYEYRGKNEDRYTKVYIPCRASGEGNRRVGMVLLSSAYHSDSEVVPLGIQRQFTGMIVNDIRSLQQTEKSLLNSIPGVNAGSVLIFELDRKPSSTAGLIAMFGVSAAMLLAALAWMFLTGQPD